MKAALDQEAMRMATIASSSDTKPILDYVNIGNGEIIVSDGFMLARKPIETEGEGEALVKATDILKAKKAGGKGLEKISINADKKIITDEKGVTNTKFEPLQTDYPNLEQMYPTSERKAFVALDSRMLAKLLKGIENGTAIKFRIRGPNEPIEFIAGDVSGLIMPIYYTEEDERWHKEKK